MEKSKVFNKLNVHIYIWEKYKLILIVQNNEDNVLGHLKCNRYEIHNGINTKSEMAVVELTCSEVLGLYGKWHR